MAAIALANSKTATLVANTADTITPNAPAPCRVEIANNDATAVIWMRMDGTPATVAGDDCQIIPAGTQFTPPGMPNTISLISSGTPQYTVSRVF